MQSPKEFGLMLTRPKEELKEVMKALDIVVACKNIVTAWNYITDTLIQKCFQEEGFLTMVPTHPDPEPHPDCNLWDNIQRFININVPFEEFAKSDDNVETSIELSEGNIIDRVKVLTRGDDKDGEDPDGPDDDEDEAVLVTNTSMADENEIITNSDQFLSHIAQQMAYVIHNQIPERCIEALNEVKQIVIDSKVTSCRK